MPTEQILGILIAEREKLTRAIEALQGPIKRRGRPPKVAVNGVQAAPGFTERKRKPRTAAQRKAQSDKMKKYWAQRRKAQ